MLAGSGLGLAGVSAAIAIGVTAANTAPAFAVTQNHDGTVSVRIASFSAIPAANAQLRSLGVHAQIVQAAAGCAPAALAGQVRPADRAWALSSPPKAAGRIARFDPRRVDAGRTEALSVGKHGARIQVAAAGSVAGQAPSRVAAVRVATLAAAPCQAVGIEVPRNGPNGNGGDSDGSGAGGQGTTSTTVNAPAVVMIRTFPLPPRARSRFLRGPLAFHWPAVRGAATRATASGPPEISGPPHTASAGVDGTTTWKLTGSTTVTCALPPPAGSGNSGSSDPSGSTGNS